MDREARIVGDDETILRLVSSPYMYRDGVVFYTAFLLDGVDVLSKPETYMSVWRESYIDMPIKDVPFNPRRKGNKWVGYCSINAGECRMIKTDDCSVVEIKQVGNAIYHAGVYVECGDKRVTGECRSVEYLEFAYYLSTKFEFHKI